MPRGHTQWPAGLFWPDCEHRVARPGPCCLTLDRGDGSGGGERACPGPACDQRAKANAQTRGAERHRGQGFRLRDLLIGAVVEDGLSPLRNPSTPRTAIDGYRFAPPILRAKGKAPRLSIPRNPWAAGDLSA